MFFMSTKNSIHVFTHISSIVLMKTMITIFFNDQSKFNIIGQSGTRKIDQ